MVNRHGFRAFSSFAGFPAIQDDAAVFGHARPAGPDAVLYQQISNGRIRNFSPAQFHDGIMDGFQIIEGHAMRIRPEFLNRFPQSFKIGRWFNWCVHNF